jgi:hypothetical protein
MISTPSDARCVRIALALAAALSLCCAVLRGTDPLRIPLRWAPTDDLRLPAGAAKALSRQTIYVYPFTDARQERGSIGKNTEGKTDLLVFTPDNVAIFLTGRFREVLNANGILIVGPEATRVIKAEVRRYFVTEGSNYQADAMLLFTVEDGAGGMLWQGLGEGHATLHGRSFRENLYQQSLSNAFLDAIKNIIVDQEFLAALANTTRPPALPKPSTPAAGQIDALLELPVMEPLLGKLAVLDLRNFAPQLSTANIRYLTDVVRQVALRVAPKADVMTRENLLILLQVTGKNPEECEGECEVDTGRRIGADLILSGDIQKLGLTFKISLRMHNTKDGRLISAALAEGSSPEKLDGAVMKAAEEIFSSYH